MSFSEDLQKQFDEQIRARIDEDENKIVINDAEFSPAQVLSSVAEDVYKDAFREWKTLEWLPAVLKRADGILKKFDNGSHFTKIVRAAETGRIVPFIGSGMSCPSNFPLWNSFLFQIREKSHLEEAVLAAMLKAGEYEEAASEILRSMPTPVFNDKLARTFELIAFTDLKGAVRLLPYIFGGDVITLNFDNVIEELYKFHNSELFVLAGERVADFRRRSLEGKRCLLKYHGTYDEPRTRVLTKEEYDKNYAVNSESRRVISDIFSNKKLLFLGCSLNQDRTMAILQEIAEADENMPQHYAFLPAPANDLMLEREHFLGERFIFPIWYEGDHDECIEALLVKLLNELGAIETLLQN